jgi:hypothetical protein
MFQIMTADNTAHITLNDNLGRAPTEAMLIGNDAQATGWAIFGYAKRHHIPARDVGYALRSATPKEVGQ